MVYKTTTQKKIAITSDIVKQPVLKIKKTRLFSKIIAHHPDLLEKISGALGKQVTLANQSLSISSNDKVDSKRQLKLVKNILDSVGQAVYNLEQTALNNGISKSKKIAEENYAPLDANGTAAAKGMLTLFAKAKPKDAKDDHIKTWKETVKLTTSELNNASDTKAIMQSFKNIYSHLFKTDISDEKTIKDQLDNVFVHCDKALSKKEQVDQDRASKNDTIKRFSEKDIESIKDRLAQKAISVDDQDFVLHKLLECANEAMIDPASVDRIISAKTEKPAPPTTEVKTTGQGFLTKLPIKTRHTHLFFNADGSEAPLSHIFENTTLSLSKKKRYIGNVDQLLHLESGDINSVTAATELLVSIQKDISIHENQALENSLRDKIEVKTVAEVPLDYTTIKKDLETLKQKYNRKTTVGKLLKTTLFSIIHSKASHVNAKLFDLYEAIENSDDKKPIGDLLERVRERQEELDKQNNIEVKEIIEENHSRFSKNFDQEEIKTIKEKAATGRMQNLLLLAKTEKHVLDTVLHVTKDPVFIASFTNNDVPKAEQPRQPKIRKIKSDEGSFRTPEYIRATEIVNVSKNGKESSFILGVEKNKGTTRYDFALPVIPLKNDVFDLWEAGQNNEKTKKKIFSLFDLKKMDTKFMDVICVSLFVDSQNNVVDESLYVSQAEITSRHSFKPDTIKDISAISAPRMDTIDVNRGTKIDNQIIQTNYLNDLDQYGSDVKAWSGIANQGRRIIRDKKIGPENKPRKMDVVFYQCEQLGKSLIENIVAENKLLCVWRDKSSKVETPFSIYKKEGTALILDSRQVIGMLNNHLLTEQLKYEQAESAAVSVIVRNLNAKNEAKPLIA
jgi:hypothetical protein